MAHAQKPDFVFLRKGRVHLNWRGCQFNRLLAAEVCAWAVVMLDTPCSEVVWEYWLPTPFASFPFTSSPVRHRVPSHFNLTLPMELESAWASEPLRASNGREVSFPLVNRTSYHPAQSLFWLGLPGFVINTGVKKCDVMPKEMIYRVIYKSLRDFRTRLRNNQDRHGIKEHIDR